MTQLVFGITVDGSDDGFEVFFNAGEVHTFVNDRAYGAADGVPTGARFNLSHVTLPDDATIDDAIEAVGTLPNHAWILDVSPGMARTIAEMLQGEHDYA